MYFLTVLALVLRGTTDFASRYLVVPWLHFNFNHTILCLILVIFNTSSGIKYVLLQLTVVTSRYSGKRS